MLYIARVKIKLEANIQDRYYEKGKWLDLFKYNEKKCKWRIKDDGSIDFIIGAYENRYEALEDGKILYFNILYEIHRSGQRFNLGDSKYVTRMYHEDRGYTADEFTQNEEWFFNTKRDSADFLGLGVYEIDKDIEEYDEYGKIFITNFTIINEKPFTFLEKIKKMDSNYKYSKKSQEIFNLIRLSENTDSKTKLLLLCQALEMMGKNENRSEEEIIVIDRCISCIEESNLSFNKKESLKSMLSQSKKISSKNKCRKLINTYCIYEYEQFDKNKLFDEAYKVRGKIIHGEEIDNDTVIRCSSCLKVMVLDVLKEWSKNESK